MHSNNVHSCLETTHSNTLSLISSIMILTRFDFYRKNMPMYQNRSVHHNEGLHIHRT